MTGAARVDFIKLVGADLIHYTPASNMGGIDAHGLLPPETLAQLAGIDPATLILRAAPVQFTAQGHPVRLNHQRPLRAGASAAFLDAHSLASWAAQLDRRVFFWPATGGAAFSNSLPAGMVRLTLDAGAVYDALADHLWLSPINSGNATRKPAPRGDWLYVPATACGTDFRTNRQKRGLVKNSDTVQEVSLTCPLPADLLRSLLR